MDGRLSAEPLGDHHRRRPPWKTLPPTSPAPHVLGLLSTAAATYGSGPPGAASAVASAGCNEAKEDRQCGRCIFH
ncbi:hypothetical protein E2562_023281 [Oryza meyeriana var. granulata]|uniref:Uncharacterized protein n=1 Tax=Oryza meyeriana var. granulata TaxID=110450 RepID=A0A6G1DPC6_9ORYZ|nr:hypothetical protein E2562_023281 [Oryza meyeriana var. granulata]